MVKFPVLLLFTLYFLPFSCGLKCYICNSYPENGKITNKFCKDPGKFAKSRVVLKPCNSFKEAFNDELYRHILHKSPKLGKYVLTCSKLTVSAGNFTAIERNCAIEEKLLANSCKSPTPEEFATAKSVAVEMGASVQNSEQVELQMCHCNWADGCNPKHKVEITATPTTTTEATTTSTTEPPTTAGTTPPPTTAEVATQPPKFLKPKIPPSPTSQGVKIFYDNFMILNFLSVLVINGFE